MVSAQLQRYRPDGAPSWWALVLGSDAVLEYKSYSSTLAYMNSF